MFRRRHDPATTIASIELFATCTRSEQALLQRLSTLTDVDSGAVLCAEGELGQTFYVLVEGEARVSVDGDDVARLGPGCGFGEIALLRRGGRRIATVTTSTPARLVVFSRPEFATLMAEVPRIAWSVMAECRRRLDGSPAHDGPWATS
jgi:CRP-like cAMP-binding protein